MKVERQDLDQLRCEITSLPTRHYNHAARTMELAERLMEERDAALAKLEKYERDSASHQ